MRAHHLPGPAYREWRHDESTLPAVVLPDPGWETTGYGQPTWGDANAATWAAGRNTGKLALAARRQHTRHFRARRLSDGREVADQAQEDLAGDLSRDGFPP